MTNPARHSVSVIIPVFNGEDVISSSIESVINQTYQADEIIVIDDGSTDSTKSIVARYAASVRYIYQNNAGPAAARNHGITSANSEFIAFLDSDDIWIPSKLEQQIRRFLQDDTIGLVASGYCFCSENMEHRKDYTVEKFSSKYISFKDLLSENYVGTSSAVVRRDCFEKVGYFDESMVFGEDWNLWLRIARQYKVAYVAAVLCKYREHDRSISSSRARKNLEDLRLITQENARMAIGFREKMAARKAIAGYYLALAQQYRGDEDKGKEVKAALQSILNWPFLSIMNYGSLLRYALGTKLYYCARKNSRKDN